MDSSAKQMDSRIIPLTIVVPDSADRQIFVRADQILSYREEDGVTYVVLAFIGNGRENIVREPIAELHARLVNPELTTHYFGTAN